MKTKKERLYTIRDLVRKHALNNQEELLNLLYKDGFTVTQATLSRDMKQLKIIKIPNSSGNYIYALPGDNEYTKNIHSGSQENDLATRGFISIEFSGSLAVVKTRPGYAMGIASDIDSRATQSVLGTIAGDDTILLIPREGIDRKEIVESLSLFIPNIKH